MREFSFPLVYFGGDGECAKSGGGFAGVDEGDVVGGRGGVLWVVVDLEGVEGLPCPEFCAGASWKCQMGIPSLLWLTLSRGQALGVWREAFPRGQVLGILLEVESVLGCRRSRWTMYSW